MISRVRVRSDVTGVAHPDMRAFPAHADHQRAAYRDAARDLHNRGVRGAPVVKVAGRLAQTAVGSSAGLNTLTNVMMNPASQGSQRSARPKRQEGR